MDQNIKELTINGKTYVEKTDQEVQQVRNH